MKKPYNVLTLRIPRDLKDRLEHISRDQGVSMNQLAVYALTRELNELETTTFFENQHKHASPAEILASVDAVMAKASARETPDWDRIEEQEGNV